MARLRQMMKSNSCLICSTSCAASAVLPMPTMPSMASRRVFSCKIHCLRVVSSDVRSNKIPDLGISAKYSRTLGLALPLLRVSLSVGELGTLGECEESPQKLISPICTISLLKFQRFENFNRSKVTLKFDLLTSSPTTSDSSFHNSEAISLM